MPVSVSVSPTSLPREQDPEMLKPLHIGASTHSHPGVGTPPRTMASDLEVLILNSCCTLTHTWLYGSIIVTFKNNHTPDHDFL